MLPRWNQSGSNSPRKGLAITAPLSLLSGEWRRHEASPASPALSQPHQLMKPGARLAWQRPMLLRRLVWRLQVRALCRHARSRGRRCHRWSMPRVPAFWATVRHRTRFGRFADYDALVQSKRQTGHRAMAAE